MTSEPHELTALVAAALAEANGQQGMPAGAPDIPAMSAQPTSLPTIPAPTAPTMPTMGSAPAGAATDPLVPDPGAGDPARLASAMERAPQGDVSAAQTLSTAVARRNPLEAPDPLPKGRDPVANSVAAISAGHDPSTAPPELIGFHLSDDYPRDDRYDPDRGGGAPPAAQPPAWLVHNAIDAPASAMWPAPPPKESEARRHSMEGSWPAPMLSTLVSPPEAPVDDLPPWLNIEPGSADLPAAPSEVGPEGVPSWRPDVPDGTPVATDPAMPASAESRVHHAPKAGGSSHRPFAEGTGHPLEGIRADFPALQQKVNGQPLVWLDNGATTQKPNAVIDAVSDFYRRDNSNVHRGAHTLAARATDAYESARSKVQRYLGANAAEEIVFVRGATEAINLVAQAWGRANVSAGDEILLTHLEHHANIVPWQLLAQEKGASLRVVPVDDDGNVRLDAYEAMLSPRVKIVAMPQVANAIGTLLPVAPMAALAHQHGARVLVDGAQSAAHLPVDVSCLGADFFVFSGHKVYGPTGIGVLWGRKDVLDGMPPWQGGGSMIKDVTFERTVYAEPPTRFEAGTPHLAGAVGLGAALDYVDAIGRPQVAAYEHMLLEQMLLGLRSVPGLRIVGEPMVRAAVVSFVVEDREPSEIGRHLDRRGIAVRAGHHCAQPILRRLGLEETVRASLGLYNTPSDIERLVAALRELGSSRGTGKRLRPQ